MTACVPQKRFHAARGTCWSLRTFVLLAVLVLLAVTAQTAQAGSTMSNWPQVALSKDKTPISYEVYGSGEPTLILVHGWSTDARYWRLQVEYLARKYRVVALDLAGHGHSGLTREDYSMQAFGEDVRAVAEAVGSSTIILVGHSMGGQVIAEAARLMPEKVIGLIGVDSYDNIEYPMSRSEMEMVLAPMIDDFREASRAFVADMLLPSTDPQLRAWILADMSSAPPHVALSALEEMMDLFVTGKAARVFDDVKAPVVSINGDLWPVNTEANQRHMHLLETITIQQSDHFLMLARPHAFNQALEQGVHAILRHAAQKETNESGSSLP